jgi:hypothetical protein
MQTGLITLVILACVAHLSSCKERNHPVPIPDESASYTVSTLAGGQASGYVNATGTDATRLSLGILLSVQADWLLMPREPFISGGVKFLPDRTLPR